jgi:manganese efflux pump family protein
MDLFALIFTGVGLAMDCFAVSLGIGTGSRARTVRPIFRLSFHFGLFQGLMTLIGWLVGSTIANLIASLDHWLVMGLLGWVGIRMIIEGFKPFEDETRRTDPSRGGTLILLSVATSLDAMAVGLSLAIIKVDIISSSLIIGVISAALSLFGLLVGKRLGLAFGKRMEIIGGLILLFIGLRILITHLLP